MSTAKKKHRAGNIERFPLKTDPFARRNRESGPVCKRHTLYKLGNYFWIYIQQRCPQKRGLAGAEVTHFFLHVNTN